MSLQDEKSSEELPRAVEVGRRFAKTLDRRRYDDLLAILDVDCVYLFRGRTVAGSSKIIEEYRNGTEWAFGHFDRIEFSSEVVLVSKGQSMVTFTDQLYSGSNSHTFTCQQFLTVDDRNKVTQIEHADVDGEAESLEDFLTECGIEWPS